MELHSNLPTLTEVAQKAGVSRATASRALRGDPRVLPETRARIEKVANELGYRANPVVGQLMAQLRKGLKESYKATLGIMSPMTAQQLHGSPPQRKFVEGATARATEMGYNIECFWMLEPGVTVTRWKQILDTRNIRGVLVTGLFDRIAAMREDASPQNLLQKFKPVWDTRACVVIGARSTDPALHFAANDLFTSSTLALKELARLGYRKPAHFVERRLDAHLENRFTGGFLAGYEGISTSPEMVFRMDYPADVPAMLKWIRRHRPDVIICGEERMAGWLRDGGFRVPEDIGVIRVDLHLEEPEWAGVNQNSALVATGAVDLLIGQLHRGEYGSPAFQKCVLIEGRWVDGNTVRQQKSPPVSA